MASRSTRRRIKNSEITKLDECQNEEESHTEDSSSIGKRRSLRHSPGSSSLSPPRKTRRTKESATASENKSPKASTSPNKSPKSSLKEFSHGMKELNDTESNKESMVESSGTRKSTRNSSVALNTSPNKMTRTNSLPLHSPSKRNIQSKVCNVNEAASALPSRITRSKASSPCDKQRDGEDILKDASPSKFRKGVDVTSPNEVKNTDCVPSISHSYKRSLPLSPELPAAMNDDDLPNSSKSTMRSSKRVCHSSSTARLHPTTNGKACITEIKSNLDQLKTSKLSSDNRNEAGSSSSSCNTNLSTPLSPSLNKASTLSCDMPKSNKSEESHTKEENLKEMNKRRRSNESIESSENASKKPKCDKLIDLSTDSAAQCVREKETFTSPIEKLNRCKVNSNLESANKAQSTDNTLVSEKMDTLSEAELLLLKEFNLTELQSNEVCNLLSSNVKESSPIVIVEELIRKLLKETSLISSMNSPRFNKFLRQLLIKYCSCDTSVERKHQLCESALEWSKERKSVNLRHELELALMTLYFNTGFFRKAEEMATGLYKETKKLQDKEKTVKACLCLSKAYHAMGNIAKARANITTAKTEALKIYTPPDLQGELDLQSGIMQVAEEKDMETAFSYFKEAACGFTVRANRSRSLKYMLLTKLLVNKPEDGEKAVRSQCHVEDIDEGVEAMLSITKAAVSSSLADFKKAREQYVKELEEDLVVRGVLDLLYSKMLEKNLLNIISPYARMQISVVAEKIGLGRDEVERRLSQMILDGQISAQLDHRDDCLYVYQAEEKDGVYEHALDSVSQFDRTLSLLNRRIKQLL